jgi:uncharacterized protein DUF6328
MADLQRKTKFSLDETRMLILGSHILLGFQFNAVFQQDFEHLPAHTRYLDAGALLLMLTAIALLILPSVRHRVVEEGRDSEEFCRFITGVAGIALLPFAITLGLDLFLLGEKIFGTTIGIAAGAAAGGLALFLWYGIEALRRRRLGREEHSGMDEPTSKSKPTPLSTRIEQMLTEARVILPGAQALFGFQLVCVLSQAFDRLPDESKLIHALSAGCVALAVMLLMAPAAYHRIVWGGEDSEEFQRTGSLLMTAATVPLAFGLAGDAYVVIAKIAESPWIGAVAAGLVLAALIGLWYAYPLYLRRERHAGTAARHRPAERRSA